jgi:anti-sigma28 factor (negative regulator of flagellin synthesis)
MIDPVTNPVHAGAQTTTRDGSSSGHLTCASESGFEQVDAVELSPTARDQLGRDESAPVRTRLVERIRGEIAAGTYLTDAKLDAAADRMRAEIFNAG